VIRLCVVDAGGLVESAPHERIDRQIQCFDEDGTRWYAALDRILLEVELLGFKVVKTHSFANMGPPSQHNLRRR